METDSITVRLVIGLLGLTLLVCVVGGIVLIGRHCETPAWIANLAFSIAAGLTGWLIPSPLNKKS